MLMAEKETLQREIDEGRAILDGVDVDVESRRKIMEEYAQMKAEMRRCGIGAEDPRKIQAFLQRLKSYVTEGITPICKMSLILLP